MYLFGIQDYYWLCTPCMKYITFACERGMDFLAKYISQRNCWGNVGFSGMCSAPLDAGKITQVLFDVTCHFTLHLEDAMNIETVWRLFSWDSKQSKTQKMMRGNLEKTFQLFVAGECFWIACHSYNCIVSVSNAGLESISKFPNLEGHAVTCRLQNCQDWGQAAMKTEEFNITILFDTSTVQNAFTSTGKEKDIVWDTPDNKLINGALSG